MLSNTHSLLNMKKFTRLIINKLVINNLNNVYNAKCVKTDKKIIK